MKSFLSHVFSFNVVLNTYSQSTVAALINVENLLSFKFLSTKLRLNLNIKSPSKIRETDNNKT